MTDFHHLPVMVDRILEVFASVPAGWIIDATVGGGGHADALLSHRDDLRIVGIDQDPMALAASAHRLERYGERVRLVRARFDDLHSIMTDLRLPPISGALFDLGVSSPQLDLAERGFSYNNDGPVDMRMDTDQSWSGADVVNGYTATELARVLRRNGDERFADRIASAIVSARPIESTAELAQIVRDAIPAPARRHGGHPAKRTFQAIRIEVNSELAILPHAIDEAIEVTAPEGRVAVLTYHSGEDRIVKGRFRQAETGGCTCPVGLPCVCDAVRTVRVLKAGGWTASADELAINRRAESARLRAVEKLRPAVGE
jgi:16S rRNA (cytosine1402-N4)-methyltransferase